MATPIDKTRSDFYARFDNGQFNPFHKFIAGVRADNMDSVRRFFEQVKADKGEDYATKVVADYYKAMLKRNPLNWNTIDYYVKLETAFQKETDRFSVAMQTFLTQQINAFIEANLSSCPDSYETMCKSVDGRQSWFEKAKYHLSTGGVGRLFRKGVKEWTDKIGPKGAAGIGDEYKTGRLELKKLDGALPGFWVEDVHVNGKRAAVIITGDPKKGARIGMKVVVGGGATVESVEEKMGDHLQYQGPGSFQHGEKLSMELMIADGRPVVDKPPDATRHDGYIIVRADGSIKISDKRRLLLSDITGKPEDDWVVMNLRGEGDITDILRYKEEMALAHASQASAMLLVKDNTVEWAVENGADERRILAEFSDGTFAVISTYTQTAKDGVTKGDGVGMGINDLLTLLLRIGKARGGVKSAVYLDTGHYDYTSYYTYEGGRRKRVVIGHPDSTTQMCRIYFYQR